jgi:hypothetical protein
VRFGRPGCWHAFDVLAGHGPDQRWCGGTRICKLPSTALIAVQVDCHHRHSITLHDIHTSACVFAFSDLSVP